MLLTSWYYSVSGWNNCWSRQQVDGSSMAHYVNDVQRNRLASADQNGAISAWRALRKIMTTTIACNHARQPEWRAPMKDRIAMLPSWWVIQGHFRTNRSGIHCVYIAISLFVVLSTYSPLPPGVTGGARQTVACRLSLLSCGFIQLFKVISLFRGRQ